MNANDSLDLAEIQLKPSARDKEHSFASLKKLFESDEKQIDRLINKISDALIAVCATDELKSSQNLETRYVVNMTKEIREAVQNNLVKFDRGKNGEIFAQFRDENNRYGKKLSISEELTEQGINGVEAMNALQLKAIQAQLAEMANTIDAISQDVETVLQGQHNDRIGIFYSGQELLIEAQSIQNESLKNLVYSQALKALSDATGQLSQQMQTDINYLIEGKYKNKTGKRESEIEARITSINNCFEVIHRAASLKVATYYELKELPAMLATVSDYGRFLASAVVPNASRLTEFDAKETLLKGGIWEQRAHSFSEIEELRNQLQSEFPLFLQFPTMKEDENSER